MKKVRSLILILLTISMIMGCNKVNYRKSKSGIVYKLFPGNSKDSTAKHGQVVKFQVTTKMNDSLMYSSYDKMPAFVRIMIAEPEPYNIMAVLPLMRTGDSAVIIQMVDSLLKISGQAPVGGKKGDRITTTINMLQVFTNDSIAMADYQAAAEKDRPRQMKEQEAEMAKELLAHQQQQEKQDQELEKSGEMAKELAVVEDYLKAKKISATKTGKGTYVVISQQGQGPKAAIGKYVHVKYTGKFISNDSTFQSNTYEFPLGKGRVMRGWDEGIQLFSQGGKGVLYVPGFLAYGPNPPERSPFKPNEALKFDVELLSISDTPTVRQRMQ